MLGVYKVTQPFAGHEEGEILHLEEEVAAALQGYVEAATDEDVSGPQEEEAPADVAEALNEDEEQNAYAKRAVSRLAKSVEASIAKATELAIASTVKKAHKLPKVAAVAKDPRGGFANLGDFMRCLSYAQRGDWQAQAKLRAYETAIRQKAPTGMGESVQADGGYSVIPEWTDSIWDKVRSKFNLLEYVDKQTVGGQVLKIPAVNETSRVNGSRHGGLQSFYIGEGDAFTGSKLTLAEVSLSLLKLGVFVYMSNELIADNAFNLTGYVQDKVGSELLFKTNDGLVNGTGSSQPTGILNAAAKVTVTKEAGQSAATVLFANLAKMWGQLYWASMDNAIWIMNQEVYQQLIQMAFTTGGTTPARGLTYNAADEFQLRIFGRPAHIVENCAALGNEGDIILCDLSQYVVIDKPLEIAVSTDFNFNKYETVYRFVYRWDAKSPWTGALTPYLGSKTLSPFITLQARGT